MPLAPGDVFAGYTVVRQLGSGGMGSVYLARHPRLPRLDALKLLRPEFSADEDYARRFLREADLAAALSHPNIVSVLDRGEEGDQLWLSMHYVDGIDAEAGLAAAGGLLPADRAVSIVHAVAAALDHAHRHHVVHRDVKPANILLARSGAGDEPERALLTDFGIAKPLDDGPSLTRTGAVMATFDYASPEQLESRPMDGRSDLYSLTCVLYTLLTGSVPYPGYALAAAIYGHIHLPPPRVTDRVPWLPPAIDDVVARGMAKDPGQRYETCRALAAAATSALADFPPAPPPPYRLALSRGGEDPPAAVGPWHTDGLPEAERDQLAELVRRTRFFDLPETLIDTGTDTRDPGSAPPGDPVTIEIAAARRSHRVQADLAGARRPPDLDELVAAIDRGPPAPIPVPVASGADPAPHTQLPAPAPPVRPPPRRRRTRLVVSAAVVVVLAAAGVIVAVLAGDDGGQGGGPDPSDASSGTGGEAPVVALDVGLAYDVGGRGDRSYNDSAFAGVQAALTAHGGTYAEATPASDGTDGAEVLTRLADQGHDPVIAVGSAYSAVIADVARRHPEVTFAQVDAYVPDGAPPNLTGLVFAEEQGSYLAGVAAALKTTTDHIGFVGGVETPLLQKFQAGYQAGARAVRPEIRIDVQYLSPPGDFSGFDDPAAGQLTAQNMYDDGADIVYSVAGGSGVGVFQAAAASHAWAIGVDIDQYNTVDDPALQAVILTSVLKRVDNAVERFLDDVAAGRVQGGTDVVNDLSTHGVGLATSGGFIDDIGAQLEEYEKNIVSGRIVVPTTT